jgi:hypothetical protein
LLLGVIGVEADVLLELEALLLDEGDRLAGLTVGAGQRELVVVDDGADALTQDELVVGVGIDRHARTVGGRRRGC